MASTNKFIIRVYGILISEGFLLAVKESYLGKEMLKFPGGGLEFGEGLLDCIQREWLEETGEKLTDCQHFYTTDFFQASAFHADAQVISVYYKVTCPEIRPNHKIDSPGKGLEFVWLKMVEIDTQQFTMPIDQFVAGKLKYASDGF